MPFGQIVHELSDETQAEAKVQELKIQVASLQTKIERLKDRHAVSKAEALAKVEAHRRLVAHDGRTWDAMQTVEGWKTIYVKSSPATWREPELCEMFSGL